MQPPLLVEVVDGDIAHTAIHLGEPEHRQATLPPIGVDVAPHFGLAVCEIGHLGDEHQEVAVLARAVQRTSTDLHALTTALCSNESGQCRARAHEHYVLSVLAGLGARPVDRRFRPGHILLPSRVSTSAV